MRFYELTYLINPDLSELELNGFCQKINGFITEEGGIVNKEKSPIRQRLGYSVNKKTEAFLVNLTLSLNPENLEKLEKKIKNEKQIMRYMVSAKQSLEETKREPSRASLRFSKTEAAEKKGEKPKEHQKIELKEIDEKIDEILKE
jgi:small subunit ribosomal protein S6